ncbi:hypothetical protein DW228_18380 [Bacteroides fragilis]|uniref:Type VI secretion system transmembrane protein TssO n=1 Tax=Bacteroides fragilis TaxID=817 RepID=A0A396BX41_BACFG|nr:type VI secretion system transmembrane protein TssO [Bacteroides fragilis]RHH07901.1 hypothetical protein DW228_18380 [Bacteroides fragilis]
MEKNKQPQTTNSREKLIGFLYVLILFTVATFICCVILFRYNTNFKIFSRKDFVIIKMERIRNFQQIQNKEFIIIDSLYNSIHAYNPGITALYEENDIKYLLNEMKDIYERSPWDKRYKAFYHTAGFYEMWFTDKKELWSKQENVAKFKANLEQCEIGLQNKKDELRNLKK